jgi:hypothetical protein
MLSPKLIKFFNTPLVTHEVRATCYKVLFSLLILMHLALLGLAISILAETFQLLGYDGDMIVLSMITIFSPIILCILCLGELVPRYKARAKQASRWLLLFCALTMIANNVTQHF